MINPLNTRAGSSSVHEKLLRAFGKQSQDDHQAHLNEERENSYEVFRNTSSQQREFIHDKCVNGEPMWKMFVQEEKY